MASSSPSLPSLSTIKRAKAVLVVRGGNAPGVEGGCPYVCVAATGRSGCQRDHGLSPCGLGMKRSDEKSSSSSNERCVHLDCT